MKLRFYLIRILLSDWKSRRFEDKAGMESQQQQMWSADSLYIATLQKCDFSSGIRWITDCKYLCMTTYQDVIPHQDVLSLNSWTMLPRGILNESTN